jgi:hypothetical protein
MAITLFKNRCAWIVEWHVHRRDSTVIRFDRRPYILPRRWKAERVLNFMRCLYWNSSEATPSETLLEINKQRPEGIRESSSGKTLVYGGATFLFAYLADNLTVKRSRPGQFIVTWRNHSRHRRWVWKCGCWLQDAESFSADIEHLPGN